MKLRMKVYLDECENNIVRELVVDDSMNLKKFCQMVVFSMNGSGRHLCFLVKDEGEVYLSSNYNPTVYKSILMDNLKVRDLKLKVGDELVLEYDYSFEWDFVIQITQIIEEDCNKEFEVIGGLGMGILEGCRSIFDFRSILRIDINDEREMSYYTRKKHQYIVDYVKATFDVHKVNEEIEEKYRELVLRDVPKNYVLSVCLDGYDSQIKREIVVNGDLSLNVFCQGIIRIMRGDLSHLYGIKIDKEFIDNEYDALDYYDIKYLGLKEKKKFKVYYDFGDDWCFIVNVKKIKDGFNDKRFEVISGKGYGIVDDCGGVWGLSRLFNKEVDGRGDYDIDDFDLEKIRKIVEGYIK